MLFCIAITLGVVSFAEAGPSFQHQTQPKKRGIFSKAKADGNKISGQQLVSSSAGVNSSNVNNQVQVKGFRLFSPTNVYINNQVTQVTKTPSVDECAERRPARRSGCTNGTCHPVPSLTRCAQVPYMVAQAPAPAPVYVEPPRVCYQRQQAAWQREIEMMPAIYAPNCPPEFQQHTGGIVRHYDGAGNLIGEEFVPAGAEGRYGVRNNGFVNNGGHYTGGHHGGYRGGGNYYGNQQYDFGGYEVYRGDPMNRSYFAEGMYAYLSTRNGGYPSGGNYYGGNNGYRNSGGYAPAGNYGNGGGQVQNFAFNPTNINGGSGNVNYGGGSRHNPNAGLAQSAINSALGTVGFR